jgi:hypothetical protein
MNLLSESSEGNVKIKHHSTSSCFYITIDLKVETSQGVFENDKQSFFVDYNTFDNLQKCINKFNPDKE